MISTKTAAFFLPVLRIGIVALLATVVSAASWSCRVVGSPLGTGSREVALRPAATGASVSFSGTTQAGTTPHSLSVRRILYQRTKPQGMTPGLYSYVVYDAGDEYGPVILKRVAAVAPMVRLVADDEVEIFFTSGAHTHVKQRWKLLGYTAELISEEAVDWRDAPQTEAR